jgi:hypothetical protein
MIVVARTPPRAGEGRLPLGGAAGEVGRVTGQDRRRRLVEDVDRTRGLMLATIQDARRASAEVPIGVTASVEVWRAWADRLRELAEE